SGAGCSTARMPPPSGSVISRLDWVFRSVIGTSTRTTKHARRKQDQVHGEDEQGRMPDIAQQPEATYDPAQRAEDDPGRHHHHGNGRDIDAEQIDLGKAHQVRSESK